MTTATSSEAYCPECGASVKPGLDRCWLCQRPQPIDAIVIEPPGPFSAAPPRRGASPTQFSLETLLMIVTLVAVCLGLLMAAPGLGVLVSIVAAPALVRTLIAGYQRRAVGTPLSAGEKVLAFLASTGVTFAVLLAGLAAFGTACFATCLGALGLEAVGGPSGPFSGGEWVVLLMLLTSAGVGIATAIWLFWILWPKRG
jgi:hypothetical protein